MSALFPVQLWFSLNFNFPKAKITTERKELRIGESEKRTADWFEK